MVVGVCRIAFSLPGNASLKGKRSIVRRIVDRTRAKFNVAVAEVAQMDSHRHAVIGLAVVSNDASHANSMADRISAFMAGISEAVVVDRRLEIVHTEGGERVPRVPRVPPIAAQGLTAEHADALSPERWDDDEL